MTFSGAVLAGGQSRRMGRDKAFVTHGGRPLAGIVRAALLEAGAAEVLSVGGDLWRLSRLGFAAIPDDVPGEGPLGGVLTALRAAAAEQVAVLSCDLPHASAATIRELLCQTADDTDVVVALLAGRPLPTHAVWRRESQEVLQDLFAGGERRLAAALGALRVRGVEVSRPDTLLDVDTPEGLAAARAVGGAGGGAPEESAGVGASVG
ncbi:MAG: molybdenum cofactor guanylyltransferase, partial [bacterium]|nr:molybdenum cofactor guanylyltransferase [bacterium]